MIGKDEYLKKICRNYHLVENYMQARFDKENKWDLHHKIEISEMKSRKQLIDEGKYYDVEAEELIFLAHSEHIILHNLNKLPDTKRKLSEANRGENNPQFGKHPSSETREKLSEAHKGNQNMLGKHHSAETKRKMSEAHKGEKHPFFGKHLSGETKQKMSNAHKGKKPSLGFYWWNNGIINTTSKECPGEGFVRGRIKLS